MDGNVLKSNSCTQQLPNELLLYMTKYWSDEDCVALALSGVVKGFAAFYSQNRKHIINNRCFFLTPSKWSVYLKQHILVKTVTSFNVNHLYWLPGQLLADAIIQMKQLNELAIKDTKVSLPILAKILNTCPEITKLDFSFRFEDDWKNLQDYRVRKVILDSMAQNFKRITCFKVSTCVLDARDYKHDPWQPILQFLSMCRDCVELSVEIIYSGRNFQYPGYYQDSVSQFTTVKQFIRESIYPHLDWMTSLTSLVLVKLGEFHTSDESLGVVRSLMLDDLFSWLFCDERAPSSLRHFWIQDFCFDPEGTNVLASAPSLISYQIGNANEIDEQQPFHGFPKLEYIAKLEFSQRCTLLHLPNLKYAHGDCCDEDEPVLNNFVRTHPNLEYLSVYFYYVETVLNQEWILPFLKVLKYSRDHIDKEIMESLVKVYPNVEILYLFNTNKSNTISTDQECLSSIKFKNLTSLSLKRFKIHVGSFLQSIITHCKKLERLDLSDANWVPPMFTSNLDLFLPLATNLQDFRLKCSLEGNGSLILPLLKSFLAHSPKLRRLVLLDYGYDDSLPEWEHPSEMPDVIVNFALKMPHLVAFCISFFHLKSDLIEEVNRRMVEEVLPSKSSLWFCLNDTYPDPSYSSVPFIHHQEMVHPMPPWVSPKVDFFTDA